MPRVQLNSDEVLAQALTSSNDTARLKSITNLRELVKHDIDRLSITATYVKCNENRVRDAVTSFRKDLRGKFISQVPLFATGVLTAEDQQQLVGKLRPQRVLKGQYVVQQGEHGDTLYIIEQGSCEVIHDGKLKSEIGREDYFGERAMLYGGPRAESVRAKTDCSLLGLRRGDLHEIITTDKLAQLAVVMRIRMFAGVPFLSYLSPRQQELVTMMMKQELWPAGSIVVREGHTGTGAGRRFYLIEEGTCRKTVRASPTVAVFGDSVADVLRAGQQFCMYSMFYGGPVSCTVTALEQLVTLSLSYDELLTILDEQISNELSRKVHRRRTSGSPMMRIRSKADHGQSCFGVSQEFGHGRIPDAMRTPRPNNMCPLALVQPSPRNQPLCDSPKRGVSRKNTYGSKFATSREPSKRDPSKTGDVSEKVAFARDLSNKLTAQLEISAENEVSRMMSKVCCDGAVSEADVHGEKGETLETLELAMTRHLLLNFLERIDVPANCRTSGGVDELLAHSEILSLEKWDTVFQHGEQVDAIYILQRGALAEHGGDVMTIEDADEILEDVDVGQGGRQSECVLHVTPGVVFGSACLHSKSGFKATTTLATTSDSTLLFVPGATLRLHFAMAVRQSSPG
jgi:CRP-like cAMP-binding protein